MKIVVILQLVLFVSCVDKTRGDIDLTTLAPREHEFQGKPVSLEHKRYFITFPPTEIARNVNFLEPMDFIPTYIGKKHGLVQIYPEGDYHTLHYPDWYYGPERPDVKVIVDTQRVVKNVYQWQHVASIGRDHPFVDSLNHDWHPVYIHSSDSDSVSIGYDVSLELFMEVLDPNGKWKSIHHPKFPGCGVGKHQILLPPYQYAITSVPKYQGDFKTKARLKLYSYENIYSNEFEVEVNLNQFKPRKGDEFALDLIQAFYYDRY